MRKKRISLCLVMVITALTLYTPTGYADDTKNLADYTNAVFASESETGNYPLKTIDGDLGTKWAAEGIGQWLCFRLKEETAVSKIGFSFTQGYQRIYQFSVQVSDDMENWTTVFDGKSSGQTDEIEWFTLNPIRGRFLRFVGRGSNVNLWNNINEVSGIELKKSAYMLNIDGRNENYIQEIEEKDGQIYLPAEDLFRSLGYDISYDEAKKTFTLIGQDQTFVFDYLNRRIKNNDETINKTDWLTVSAYDVPMIAYDIFSWIDEATATIEDQTLMITTRRYADIMKAYEKIDQEFFGILDWLVEIYDPISGGFYNTVSGATYEDFYPSLEASAYAYQVINTLGAGDSAPEEFKQKLVHFFQSSQNPETGFFEEDCPKSATYDSRDQMRVYGVVIDKLKQLGASPLYPLPSERNTANGSQNSLTIIEETEEEAKPEEAEEQIEVKEETDEEATEPTAYVDETAVTAKYDYDQRIALPSGVPEYCASVNQLLAHIKSYNWDNDTWGAGDKTYEDLSYVLLLDPDVQQIYIDACIDFLNQQQNPATGYWNNSGDIGFNAVSGAFKISRVYDRFGVCPPNPKKIADTIIETLRGGYTASAACYVRNPLSTLQILSKYDAEVKNMLTDLEAEIVELYVHMIRALFHEDGGASSLMYQSNTKFGGLRAGRMLCEGDIDGTLQMTIARNALFQLFERDVNNAHIQNISGAFWDKLMAKEPCVKKTYTAKTGVIVDEDFENVTSIEDLYANQWAFRSADTHLMEETKNGKTNHYLMANDTMETNVDSWRRSFDKVYQDAEIALSIKFDRDMPYIERKNDMSYTYICIYSGEEQVMNMNALDYGSDKVTLAFQNNKSGTITYNSFATIDRGEWAHLKFRFTHDRNNRMHVQVLLNGKLQPTVEDALLLSDAAYIDGIEARTSSTRCSKIGLDQIKVTVK